VKKTERAVVAVVPDVRQARALAEALAARGIPESGVVPNVSGEPEAYRVVVPTTQPWIEVHARALAAPWLDGYRAALARAALHLQAEADKATAPGWGVVHQAIE
jgi:hypothetical protein